MNKIYYKKNSFNPDKKQVQKAMDDYLKNGGTITKLKTKELTDAGEYLEELFLILTDDSKSFSEFVRQQEAVLRLQNVKRAVRGNYNRSDW
jgi:hypothetical protein